VPLTPAQLSAPLGQWPFSGMGTSIIHLRSLSDACFFGSTVDLLPLVPGGTFDDYVRSVPSLGHGHLHLVSATGVRDSMFTCAVTVEAWEKDKGALWLVQDAIDVVLERYRVKQPACTKGFVWGSENVQGDWAAVVSSGTPGQFCVLPHLGYHYSNDVTGSAKNCAVM
jgi:hypothetical protein